MRKKFAIILSGIMMIAALSSCGKEDKKGSTESTTQKRTEAVTTEATTEPGDTPIATGTDATSTDAIKNLMGYYKGNEYTNELAGFKVKVNGHAWRFYSAAEVAAAAGVEEQEILDLWTGEKTPYDQNMSFCMIAGNKSTGSSIIISYYYVNNELNKDTSAEFYLEVAADQIEGGEVKQITFVDKDFYALVIPPEKEGGYEQVRYATKAGDLIIVISFTIGEGETIDVLETMFSPLK